MGDQVRALSLTEIMNDIDLGPTSGVQMMFAKLQLAQSQLCKNQAESYMKQIEDIQAEQKLCAEMISKARELQNKAKTDDTTTTMPQEMVDYFKKNGLKWETTGNDYKHNKDEWDYNLKSLTNFQEQIGNSVQTKMVYLQDFIGQYNSYLQGANTQIANANQVLNNLARGQ
ncbi:MAG: hypothetical protein ACQGQP_00275 [Desulfovibrio sp.]|jgi:hypothetical protein